MTLRVRGGAPSLPCPAALCVVVVHPPRGHGRRMASHAQASRCGGQPSLGTSPHTPRARLTGVDVALCDGDEVYVLVACVEEGAFVNVLDGRLLAGLLRCDHLQSEVVGCVLAHIITGRAGEAVANE